MINGIYDICNISRSWIFTTYSKFGTAANTPSGSFIGEQGPPGAGFVLTVGGDYDIEDKDFENIRNEDCYKRIMQGQ